jgi:hypothetical protein
MTSGSSGEPFIIRRTLAKRALPGCISQACHTLHYYELRITDRQADVERVKPLHPRDNQLLQRDFNVLGLYPKIRIDAMLPLDEMVRIPQNFCPAVVTGYVGVCHELPELSMMISSSPDSS